MGCSGPAAPAGTDLGLGLRSVHWSSLTLSLSHSPTLCHPPQGFGLVTVSTSLPSQLMPGFVAKQASQDNLTGWAPSKLASLKSLALMSWPEAAAAQARASKPQLKVESVSVRE